MIAVLTFSVKNTSGKSAFSFVSFLCASKDKENKKLKIRCLCWIFIDNYLCSL